MCIGVGNRICSHFSEHQVAVVAKQCVAAVIVCKKNIHVAIVVVITPAAAHGVAAVIDKIARSNFCEGGSGVVPVNVFILPAFVGYEKIRIAILVDVCPVYAS